MDHYVAVARRSDLKEQTGHAVEWKGRLIALFLVDGEVLAMDDNCPHMGAALSSGHVENGIVTCPWHAWRFRIRDGVWADAPKSGTKLQCYDVRMNGDVVEINANW